MSIVYDFRDLCEDLKRILPANFRTTYETDSFMWIATKEYDIGVYPMHYELRLEKCEKNEKVYVEIHCESDAKITYKSKDLMGEFQKYFSKKNGYMCVKNTKTYKWYRRTDSGTVLDEDCVDLVLSQLRDLVKDTRADLIKIMGNVFS